jgi:hypothetical protein
MNGVRKVAVTISLAVLVVCVVASFLTRGVMENLPFLHGQKSAWAGGSVTHGIVDQRPWQTAQTLASLAVSAEEKEFAREAERLSDHEVDQAFAQSLRQASGEPRQLKGEALALQQRVVELQQTVKDDQARVAALTTKPNGVGPAGGAKAGSAAAAVVDPGVPGDDLDVAKAQLGLDQNELADSMVDLQRESGDQRGKIQQELTAREAAMKKYDAQNAAGDDGQTAVVNSGRYKTLAGQISAWFAQRGRMQLIDQAEQLARADVAALTGDHARLEGEAKTAETNITGANRTSLSNAGRVKALQDMAAQRNILSIIDDRLGAQQQLAALYVHWGDQVARQHKIVVHLMLQSLTSIAIIVLLTILAGWGLQLALDRMSQDRRQKQTLRTVLNLGTQLVGLLLVLLVVFGSPEQMPTILGLATAGLTVVFQDFILAFCGWFVLMGRNGIRVGDWVEIDGVGGEVVEIGLFRTWLLETGNWTANGHPTGRKISFLNGFAIKQKYFNFSTSGQWMWDEIKAEWKRVSRDESLAQFSATPSVDMRPAGAGVDIVVRYVTRAGVRLDTRNKLFGKVVELMQGANAVESGATR